jgi:hypothetical protein
MHINIANVFTKVIRTAISIHNAKVALGEIYTYMIH